MIRISPALLLTSAGMILAVGVYFAEKKLATPSSTTNIIDVSESNDEVLELSDINEKSASNSSNQVKPDSQSKNPISDLDSQSELNIAKNLPKTPTPINIEQHVLPAKNPEPQKPTLSETSNLFQQALSFSRNGNREAAISNYRQIIELKPNHQMAAINLGLLLKKQGQYQQAIDILKYALEISGGARKGKIYALLASCQFNLNLFSQAVGNYELSIEYRPSHALTWRRYAEALQYDNAPSKKVIDTYNKAIALSPSNPVPVLSKASYQQNRLDFEGAIDTLKTQAKNLHSLDNNSIEIQKQLIWAYIETNKLQAANKVLNWLQEFDSFKSNKFYRSVRYHSKGDTLKAIKNIESIKNKSEEELYLLGILKHESAQFEQSYNYLKQIDASKNAKLNYRVALSLKAQNQSQTSFNILSRLENSNIEKSRIYPPLIELASILNNKELAYSYLKRAKKISPNNVELELIHSKLDLKYFGNERNLKRLTKLHQQAPEDIKVLRALAKSLTEAKQYDLALKKYLLLEESDNSNKTSYEFSLFLHHQKDYLKSNEKLSDLLEKQSTHVDARLLMAKNWCALQELEKCSKEIERVLKLKPNHTEAIELKQSKQLAIQLGDVSVRGTN